MLGKIYCLDSSFLDSLLPVHLIFIEKIIETSVVNLEALEVLVCTMVQHTIKPAIFLIIDVPPYLHPNGLDLLKQARHCFVNLILDLLELDNLVLGPPDQILRHHLFQLVFHVIQLALL